MKKTKRTKLINFLFKLCIGIWISIAIVAMLIGGVILYNSNKPEMITLTADNTVNLRGYINGISVGNALKNIGKIRSKHPTSTIYLVIESPGGEIVTGENFIKAIKKDKNIKTITIKAASMASTIVESLPGERLMLANAEFLFHRGIPIPVVKDVEKFEGNNAKRIGMSLDAYRLKALYTWTITGKDNIRYNIADRIVEIRCDKSLDNLSDVISFPYTPNFFRLVKSKQEDLYMIPVEPITYKVKLTRCPLATQPFYY